MYRFGFVFSCFRGRSLKRETDDSNRPGVCDCPAAADGRGASAVAGSDPGPGSTAAGTRHTGKAFRFNQVKEGIYHAIGTGALAVVGNSAVIVNDNDVIVVDDHVSPAAAWVLLDEIKSITDKPVRTVINTHFHFDHAHGNQVFGRDVDIIGHEFTRDMLLKGNPLQMPLYKGYLGAAAADRGSEEARGGGNRRGAEGGPAGPARRRRKTTARRRRN